jgi:hypothetical protein
MPPRARRILDATSEFLKPFGLYLGKVWHIEDLHHLCHRYGVQKLSDAEAARIFEAASVHSSGRYGLSKVQLEAALVDYLREKVEKAKA